jgi:hypothetical protein
MAIDGRPHDTQVWTPEDPGDLHGSACPPAGPVGAHGVVCATVTLVLTVPSVPGAFLIGESILASKHPQPKPTDPGTLRAVIGAAVYLIVVGLPGIGPGAC